MPAPLTDRRTRRELIREILGARDVTSQHELVAALEEHGITATQSLVSRDLRALRVVKEGGVYRPRHAPDAGALDDVVELIHEVRTAGDALIVALTATGAASRVGLMIDRAEHPDVVGTIAGDDTVFLAVDGGRAQQRVFELLRPGPTRDGT